MRSLSSTEAIASLRDSFAKVLAAAVQTLADQAEIALAERDAEISRLVGRVENAESELDMLRKAGAIEQPEAVVAQLGALVESMGLAVKTRTAPKVTDFLAETYFDEKLLQDDSHRHVKNYITLFARVTGDKPLNTYQRRDVVEWVRTLEKLKSSLGKSPRDSTKTIKQLISESRGKPTMNETTIEKHIIHVKACFKCAIKHHKFANLSEIDALFDGIELSASVPAKQKRKRWAIDELNALFASPIWSGTRSRREDVTKRHQQGPQIHRDVYWWLPVIALWTGMRLEEIAQLHREDLQRDMHGTPFLKIHAEGDRRVKTVSSIRNVPVHPFLIEIGFLDLFATGRGKRIFPELIPSGRLSKLGDTYSTHFTDYRRACGLYERYRDFHSLRRTFISTLRSKYKVDALTVAALCGHDDDNQEVQRVQQTDDYTDYDVSDLADAVALIDYRRLGLDVANLLPRGARAVSCHVIPEKGVHLRPCLHSQE